MNNTVVGPTLTMQRVHATSISSAVTLTVYLCAVGGAEAALVLWGVTAGTLAHALILLVLLSHFTLRTPRIPTRGISLPGFAFERALPVLALLPLLRILSLTIPVRHISELYWYAMIGIPLLVAIALTARLIELPMRTLLTRGPALAEIAIALSGLPLGAAAYALVKPHALVSRGHWPSIAAAVIILLVFIGFTEELLYRGLLQRCCVALFGGPGLIAASVLAATMYMGSRSPGYVVFITGVGLLYGWYVRRTGSIWGVALGHGLLNIGALVVLPLVVG